MANKPKPFLNVGPGQIIKRNLQAMNWSNADLAEIIGMSEKSVSQLIHNKQPVTVPTARLLSKAFRTSPEFWLNLEQNYRLRNTEEGKKEEETETKAEIRKRMPILEMKKKGWLHCDRTTRSQVEAYRRFWNQDTVDFSVYEAQSLPFCARQAKTDERYTGYYCITWFRKAKTEAEKIKAQPYRKASLENLAASMPEFTFAPNDVGRFIRELAGCGVKFLLLEHLSKTFLDGASFLDGANPVLAYTARHDRIDNFWWTVAHEIAHILLHLKKAEDCFMDNLDESVSGNTKEREADARAGSLLHVERILDAAEPYKGYMTEDRLKEIADAVGLGNAVVLGILQHNGVIDWRTLPKLRRTVRDLIPAEYE